jgi:hypothetical protein
MEWARAVVIRKEHIITTSFPTNSNLCSIAANAWLAGWLAGWWLELLLCGLVKTPLSRFAVDGRQRNEMCMMRGPFIIASAKTSPSWIMFSYGQENTAHEKVAVQPISAASTC